MDDPIRDRCRDALCSNALLSQALEEGYLPSRDPALRTRLQKAMGVAARWRRARRQLLGAASVLAIAALTVTSPGPVPGPQPARPRAPIAAPLPPLQIVTTAEAAPRFEIVPTPAVSALERVRTAPWITPLERASDAELLDSGRVVGVISLSGGARRVVLSVPAPRRNLN